MAPNIEMTPLQKFKEVMQILLIVSGAVFGFYKFIYEDMIVPARRPPAVTLVAALDELDRSDGMILVRAHVVIANPGDAKVWVPALWWHVYGVSFSGEGPTMEEFVNNLRPWLERTGESLSRFSSIRRFEIAAVGRVPSYELWYQPKDESVHEQLFLVPEGQFDALQLFVDAYITKSIEKFAQTRWGLDDQGQLMPTLLIKQSGWDKDHPNLVAPFEPDINQAHFRLSDWDAMGHDFTTASLRLKPKSD